MMKRFKGENENMKEIRQCNPCPLATVCIPWDEHEEFLEPIFRRQVRGLHAAGYENLYIFGTAGEGYAVTNQQFRRIAEVFNDETQDLPGMRQLGVIGLSTAQTRERIEVGLELGFDWFQISLPGWGVVNDREMEQFFDDVLDPYPQARFLHYNNMRCGRRLSGSEYSRLQQKHPNLIASKSGGHTASSLWILLNDAPGMTHFLTEFDFTAASLFGMKCGLLVSVSSLNPERSLDFFKAGQNADKLELKNLNCELQAIHRKVISVVTAQGGHMDGAFDKIFARALNDGFPLRLLSPYQGCGEAECRMFLEWLGKNYPEWKK